MKVAIHHREKSFSPFWIAYCEEQGIDHKLVDCYESDIISQLEDCDALMWHFYHSSTRDKLIAKQVLYSVEMAGKVVFPDFRSSWHFDDKLGQKYLLEAVGAPMVPSYAFYTRKDALLWAAQVEFPKVFKLRGGAGSTNVRLVRTRAQASRLIRRAFGRGFNQYNRWYSLKERWRKYRLGREKLSEVMEGVVRIFLPTRYSRIQGKERGYVYFQDFIPDNTYDIRVNYLFNKCFASRREVRPGDFRASGSGTSDWDMSKIPKKSLALSFEFADRLQMQSAAFDFVMQGEDPLMVEVSYGFGTHPEMFRHGYWDRELNYIPGTFDPYGWMVEDVLERIRAKR